MISWEFSQSEQMQINIIYLSKEYVWIIVIVMACGYM